MFERFPIVNNQLFAGNTVYVNDFGLKNVQNHVIDPTFFYDAIEEFSFNYVIYIQTDKVLNELGRYVSTFERTYVRGSLQSHGTELSQSLEGNTTNISYSFYCKSYYRVNIGDVIFYKGNFLMITSVKDYDEFGCRTCSLQQIQLTAYRDLAEYVRFLQGGQFV